MSFSINRFLSRRLNLNLGVLPVLALISACSAGGAPKKPSSATAQNDNTGGQLTDPGSGGGDPGFLMTSNTPSSGCANSDVSVLFVIDRSGSMNCNLPPTTTSADCEAMSPPAKVDDTKPSKWEVMSQTLSTALDQLTPQDPSVKVRAGVVYFSVDNVCGATSAPAVPVDTVSPDQLDKIRKSVASQTPSGGTPIVGAAVLGYKYLHQILGAASNAHIILMTDGADSCGDYYDQNPAIGAGDHVADLINTQAPKALGVGIKTWVIGAPGSEPARYVLSNLAVSGGTRTSDDCTPGDSSAPTVGNCHYDMTTGDDFGAALKGALDHIMDVVTCRVIM